MKSLSLITATCTGLTLAMIAIVPPARAQGTDEQRSACMGDAFQFCSAQIPDVTKIEACLRQNKDKLTPACQAEFQPSGQTKLHPSHFR